MYANVCARASVCVCACADMEYVYLCVDVGGYGCVFVCVFRCGQ